MDYSRRHFVGAALTATAGLSLASCVGAPRRVVQSASLPPPTPVAPALPAQPAKARTLLDEAKAALDSHGGAFVHRDRLALADFSLPSSEPRLHLVNLESGRVDRSYLVAHGSGSDPSGTGMLQLFSNDPGSHATSRGAYLTAPTYIGKYGRSQRLVGLDPDNSLALDRAIVVHGAPYVDPALIARQGRIGRSQGCFAVEQGAVGEVMALLGEGRLLYAGRAA